MSNYLLAIDQGTTSSRAVIFDTDLHVIATHQITFPQSFPHDGWVEHHPEDLWNTTYDCLKAVLQQANLAPHQIAGLGISNQRETTLLWDRATGETLYPAIVWQDRRTAQFCHTLAQDPALVQSIQFKTGLLIDPYFSATKLAWLLDNVPHARERACKGELAFGTVDTFLLWRLTKGRVHATDASNASRTLLFNIRTQTWDEELLKLFNIPAALLPAVLDCAHHFGETDAALLGSPIPITGIAGDQQCALIGQACFEPGLIKSTYGTGCFMILNTGKDIIQSKHRLLSTVAYRLNNEVTYGLEGSIFVAGADDGAVALWQ